MLYQKDIPEAIACVVSPKDNTSPIYRITNEGMNHLQKCQNKGAIFHEHPKDVIFFEEVDVDYYDGETTIMDFRTNNSESNITNDMEMEDSLPDIDHPRRYRDSFERIDFTKIAEKFRAGVVPIGRPRKDKNATHSFKTTKQSSSDKSNRMILTKNDLDLLLMVTNRPKRGVVILVQKIRQNLLHPLIFQKNCLQISPAPTKPAKQQLRFVFYAKLLHATFVVIILKTSQSAYVETAMFRTLKKVIKF